MVNCIIKICGIRDPEMAARAAIAGANMIGIIFHPLSPRYVSRAQAAIIAHSAKIAGAEPVAVFVNHTDAEMHQICEATHIQTIQLHGAVARSHHHSLPDHYRRIYVQNISDQGVLQPDDGLNFLDAERDLILVDNANPGEGRAFDRQAFHYNLPYSWILAGGLTSSNVVTAINDLQPDGVDVSSGVESFRGYKDSFLIQQFISAVRGYNHAI